MPPGGPRPGDGSNPDALPPPVSLRALLSSNAGSAVKRRSPAVFRVGLLTARGGTITKIGSLTADYLQTCGLPGLAIRQSFHCFQSHKPVDRLTTSTAFFGQM